MSTFFFFFFFPAEDRLRDRFLLLEFRRLPLPSPHPFPPPPSALEPPPTKCTEPRPCLPVSFPFYYFMDQKRKKDERRRIRLRNTFFSVSTIISYLVTPTSATNDCLALYAAVLFCISPFQPWISAIITIHTDPRLKPCL